MKVKKVNVASMVGAVFTAVGLISILIASGVLMNHIKFNSTMPAAEAVITDITTYRTYSSGNSRTNHRVTISYRTEDDQKVEALLGTYTSSMEEGDRLRIHYDPSNTDKVKTEKYSMYGLWYTFSVIFGGLGVFVISKEIKKSKLRKFLLSDGIVCDAIITGMEYDMTVSVNNVHPFYLVCEVTNEYTGEKFEYRSESFFEDASQYIGSYIKVYVHPSKPDVHYVDLDSLSEQARLPVM